jgi:hypothetical protein
MFSKRKEEAEDTYEPDPLTKLFPVVLFGYGWQVHGFWWGMLVGGVYIALAIVLNLLYFYRLNKLPNDSDANPIRLFQRIKWLLFIVMMVGIGLSGASACHIDASGKEVCTPLAKAE